MVVTTDFFMPIVDNPRHFGRIAAANAISDVYAMGGKPCLALSVLGMPINKLPTEVIQARPPSPFPAGYAYRQGQLPVLCSLPIA